PKTSSVPSRFLLSWAPIPPAFLSIIATLTTEPSAFRDYGVAIWLVCFGFYSRAPCLPTITLQSCVRTSICGPPPTSLAWLVELQVAPILYGPPHLSPDEPPKLIFLHPTSSS